ncbi:MULTISPECIES: N-acetylmuramoyl-L-alanine amidase [unclassified Chelatococcus]|uniref:N-acetylmuramoyl-L-alanine amidase n=1 Tax=unclassified Chelatococcus TaxID=2638111 RepID=UPI001BCEE4B7|nr:MULTISPECIES: N-acetylmuramoyl-L-alanine amidase [unclassified Chelatococcus]CAH1671686.1 N-acetylmuramoyl-L-alanine amidase [Hyphomicrobiales bacterium]MBS7739047.1 N-acetylmuramoyl-L-alanine amidase [Chelatococcus sp. HY11]MBX3543482.1 N-acetylmuramoyl-L-alanine amidase [Chelatococcus sp.]MCO5076423.1 N-acetylmuramoyl-L-alanine amidase [Chelatococcus sp.]CAH1676108.1 N-acetylmuramoyl-L-alanine amidase [Hyphomicrobiales bacterium]
MTEPPSRLPRPDSPIAEKVFASPNHGERLINGAPPEGTGFRVPDMLILHYTGMPSAGEALNRLCSPVSEVSAHYFVFENGHVLQLVPEARRAWHAGISFWQGETDINSASIGIEIANPGHPGGMPAYPDVQIAAVIALSRDIITRWGIRADRVLAHSDVAPARKLDPGESFPWERLNAAGVGHWVRPADVTGGRFFSPGDRGQPIEAVQAMFALYGYGISITGVYDTETEAVVTAFQRHFRPSRVDGIADTSTLTTLRDLIAARQNLITA